jgi:orotidine-5'-phosphate decarboxylase
MLKAGVEGLLVGAEAAGLGEPVALAVTVLTSDDSAPPHIVPNRVRIALEGGCGGLILAATDLQTARELAPRLRRVVPGIRLPGTDQHDQARSATPHEAASGGADLLVVGRAVTQADDPVAAAAEVAAAVAG